jgi:hypothetical protein
MALGVDGSRLVGMRIVTEQQHTRRIVQSAGPTAIKVFAMSKDKQQIWTQQHLKLTIDRSLRSCGRSRLA